MGRWPGKAIQIRRKRVSHGINPMPTWQSRFSASNRKDESWKFHGGLFLHWAVLCSLANKFLKRCESKEWTEVYFHPVVNRTQERKRKRGHFYSESCEGTFTLARSYSWVQKNYSYHRNDASVWIRLLWPGSESFEIMRKRGWHDVIVIININASGPEGYLHSAQYNKPKPEHTESMRHKGFKTSKTFQLKKRKKNKKNHPDRIIHQRNMPSS